MLKLSLALPTFSKASATILPIISWHAGAACHSHDQSNAKIPQQCETETHIQLQFSKQDISVRRNCGYLKEHGKAFFGRKLGLEFESACAISLGEEISVARFSKS